MHRVLNRNLFLLKEHAGASKAANNYNIHDPETGDIIMLCREPNLGGFTKLLRSTDLIYTPFDVVITTPEAEQLARVTRSATSISSTARVLDHHGRRVGSFRQKLLSLQGAFYLLDRDDHVLCSLEGNWTNWNFRFKVGNKVLAHVAKKAVGTGEEPFTNGDNYVLQIAHDVPADSPVRLLIVSATMCVDKVLKG